MTKAADQLNVAQPALGLQVKQLEEELGIPLLTRHSRGVVPTPAGKKLLDRAQKILQLVDETRMEILSMHGATTETLRLGLTPSIMKLIGRNMLSTSLVSRSPSFETVVDPTRGSRVSSAISSTRDWR